MAEGGKAAGRIPVIVAPVAIAGLALVVLAAVQLAGRGFAATAFVGGLALLVASTIAERFPVPLDGVDSGGVSLQFVFGVAAIVLWGWEAGAIVMVAAPTIVQLVDRRPPVRIAYNAGVFALSALAGGLAAPGLHGRGAGTVALGVAAAASAAYAVNVALVAAVLAQSSETASGRVLISSARGTIVPFGLMASASLILVVLWERTPLLAAALAGPLLAIALYQRSHYRALRAILRLSLTDPLTGLGNHRHFHDRLEHELVDAESSGRALALCLLDVDDFKGINDRFGHPAGDEVLSQLATRFRQDGESFRLGGDEFAILLPAHDADAAHVVAQSVIDRVAARDLGDIGEVHISVGIASYPAHARLRDELIQLADTALYWAKEQGKNRVHVYRPPLVDLAGLREAPRDDQDARFRAAASLAKAVDARDTYTGSHSDRVAELAARLAARLGLPAEEVELTRLAGSLHDLGKLAVPEELLRKPGPLTDGERLVLERHPQIGYRMLESLGVDPVCDWVLHHHERWDGRGYPDGLAGPAIPLGARILLVADAYDAMTSERSYRSHLAGGEALAELRRCAGSQFDPQIVEALASELGQAAPSAAAAQRQALAC